MARKLVPALFTFIGVLALPGIALAHVVVVPQQVGIGAFETYSVSVPTEKDSPTVGLRLVLPSGLKEVSPTVKPGWLIDTKKSGDDITEIDWNGGSIPADLRDDFTFSAQAPAKPTELHWKAYQTYSDGSTISWDQTPTNSDDATGDKGPYSVTKVVNDLHSSQNDNTQATTTTPYAAYILSFAAFIMAAIALFIKRRA